VGGRPSLYRAARTGLTAGSHEEGINLEASRVFGIDLGTTHSCIAYVDEASGRPAVVSNAEGDLTTPSVVLFEDEETRVVGKEAKNAAVLYADRVVAMVKRQMGVPGWRFMFEDHEYSPEEISAYILRKLANDAETLLATPVRDVVITCPAYFGISERDATVKAGQIAGLNVLEVINEPTAAAVAYGMHDDRDQVVLVFDLGGGTFDVTLIEIKDGSVRVVATGGDYQLGGRDWDEAVVAYIAGMWQQESGSDDDPMESEETLQDLWQRAEDGKRALSARSESKIAVSHAGQRVGVTLTRAKFDELTKHLLERTVEYTRKVLETAKELGHKQFDQLLLVGGSTKMPQIAERLTQEFGIEPTVYEPDQAVAKGAAIYGQKLAIGKQIETEVLKVAAQSGDEINLDDVPEAVMAEVKQKVAADNGIRVDTVEKIGRMTVTNVASHSFGVIAADDRAGMKEYISNLVLAQTPVPVTADKKYGTLHANQMEVDLRIVENTSREEYVEVDEGREIGIAVLRMRPGLPASAPVYVKFELTQDGRLQVTGQDLSEDGEVITAVIETNRSLSEQEMEAAKSRARGVKVSG
jgi:molecular chaperone DnaK